VDGVVDEFCAAFGPAKESVKAYFDYWESVYPQYSAECTGEPNELARMRSIYFGRVHRVLS